MATLTSQQLKDSYQSLVTIGDSIVSNPTSGQLENGLGNPITALGIGTDSPDTILELDGGSSFEHLKISSSGNTSRFMKIGMDSATEHTIEASGPQCFLTFKTGATPTEKMRIDSSGNVGIGATSIATVGSRKTLHIDGSSGSAIRLSESSTDIAFLSYDSTSFFRLSSSDQIALMTAGSEAMRIDSTGNVGIGTDDPQSIIHVSAPKPTYTDKGVVFRGGTTNNNSHSGISLMSAGDALAGFVGSNFLIDGSTNSQSNTSRSSGYIQFTNSTATGETSDIRFGGLAKGTTTTIERMRILSTGGITFNGDTADVNALDDYEEGTFTPTLTYATPGTLSVSYNAGQTGGKYTKIGRQVTIELKLVLTAFTKGTASGNLLIGGLPFTSASSTASLGVGSFLSFNYTSGITAEELSLTRAIVLSNDTHIRILRMQADGAFTADDPDADSQFFISATYFV